MIIIIIIFIIIFVYLCHVRTHAIQEKCDRNVKITLEMHGKA